MQLPGRPPPTTFEFIEALALREPQRPALVQDNQSWGYEAVYLDLVRVVRVLDEFGVKAGDCVAVGTSGFQASVLLLLAAENLGAVTMSFLHEADPDAQAVFARADWVFSDAPQTVPAPAKFIAVDAAFVRRIEAVDVSTRASLPRISRELDGIHRISRTSGSTGTPKFMALTRHSHDYRVATAARAAGMTSDSRVLIAGPLVVNWQYARACACLRMGAAAFDLSRSGLRGHDITHVSALPGALEGLLDALPPGYAPRRPVTVCTSGGFLTPQLRERAGRAFGGPVLSSYGMNEASSIADEIGPDGSGVLNSGVDVRIVDAEGRDLPRGRVGVVAVRTPAMVEGYLDDAQATQAAFRGGWFHTGDLGAIAGPRVLRLAGRHDELLNVGGIKVPARDVEARVRALVQPRECAVLATNVDGGATQVGIALVMEGTVARDEVRNALAQALDVGAVVGARVLFLATLPRTGGGKVDRIALQQMFASPPPGSL